MSMGDKGSLQESCENQLNMYYAPHAMNAFPSPCLEPVGP